MTTRANNMLLSLMVTIEPLGWFLLANAEIKNQHVTRNVRFSRCCNTYGYGNLLSEFHALICFMASPEQNFALRQWFPFYFQTLETHYFFSLTHNH